MFSKLIYFGVVFVAFMVTIDAGYVTYIKKADDKYEPVMEAVSSTVEAIPMRKLTKQFSYHFEDLKDYEKNQLLTVSNINEHRRNTSRVLDLEKHYVKVEPLN